MHTCYMQIDWAHSMHSNFVSAIPFFGTIKHVRLLRVLVNFVLGIVLLITQCNIIWHVLGVLIIIAGFLPIDVALHRKNKISFLIADLRHKLARPHLSD